MARAHMAVLTNYNGEWIYIKHFSNRHNNFFLGKLFRIVPKPAV